MRSPVRLRTPPHWPRWTALLLAGSALLGAARGQSGHDAAGERPPNLVVMLADDLGWGELGCYGQRKIATPALDRLAAQGLRFTQGYCGAPVCAPSRAVLLTGRSSPYAEIRDNREVKPEGQHPLSDGAVTLAELVRDAGYATGAFGKWGLGAVGSSGDPNRQGFARFFGYICQRQAHSYYPDWLWVDGTRLWLDNPGVPGHGKLSEGETGYARFRGNEYAPARILAAAKGFVRAHAGRPFFLYVPFVQPHLAMQPPADLVDAYPTEWDATPYDGARGYVPHPRPRAGYAAMIGDLDRQVGELLALLDELGLAERTLVVFSSDNGPTHDVGGVDTAFFASTGPLRGRKGSVYEGGIRVPWLVRWPGHIAPGTVSDAVIAAQDLLPTFAELVGAEMPADSDGLSFLPILRGRPQERPAREVLAFEFRGYGGQKAVRMGDHKAVLRDIERGADRIELYDLARDPGETRDLADAEPELVARARTLFAERRSPSTEFPLRGYDR
ncbi:MAG: arylsulfatase [Planctomycetes bacterium]|nr:arylsulfatase [Planctomycetota bacterium]